MIMPLPRRMSRRVFSSAIRRATCALDKPVSGGLYFPGTPMRDFQSPHPFASHQSPTPSLQRLLMGPGSECWAAFPTFMLCMEIVPNATIADAREDTQKRVIRPLSELWRYLRYLHMQLQGSYHDTFGLSQSAPNGRRSLPALQALFWW